MELHETKSLLYSQENNQLCGHYAHKVGEKSLPVVLPTEEEDPEYIKNPKYSKKKKNATNPFKTWTLNFNREFSKEELKLLRNNIKMFSTLSN